MTDKLLIPKPTHDKLFRKAMENPIARKDFFERRLPSHIKAIIAPDSLTLEKDSFVDQSLKSSISDLLFLSKSDNCDRYIYILLEHQSKPHRFMAFRLFKYMLSICDRHLKQNPGAKKLPLIYPMVFYNGKQKYNVSQNLWGLFDDSELAKQFWSENYHLINLNEIPDEKLKGESAEQILSFFMKHIHERKLLQRWQEIAPFLRQIKINVGLDYIELFLHYTLTFMGNDDTMVLKDVLLENLRTEDGEEVMISFAEKHARIGFKEGEEKGLEKGIKLAALNMLKLGADIKLVAQGTGLAIEELLLLSKNNNEELA